MHVEDRLDFALACGFIQADLRYSMNSKHLDRPSMMATEGRQRPVGLDHSGCFVRPQGRAGASETNPLPVMILFEACGFYLL